MGKKRNTQNHLYQNLNNWIELTNIEIYKTVEDRTGLEIRVDRWPESTKNPVGPPIRAVRKFGCLPKNVGFFVAFAMAVNATNNVSYSNLIQ